MIKKEFLLIFIFLFFFYKNNFCSGIGGLTNINKSKRFCCMYLCLKGEQSIKNCCFEVKNTCFNACKYTDEWCIGCKKCLQSSFKEVKDCCCHINSSACVVIQPIRQCCRCCKDIARGGCVVCVCLGAFACDYFRFKIDNYLKK